MEKVKRTFDSVVNTIIKLAVGAAIVGGTYTASTFQDGTLTLDNDAVRVEITFKGLRHGD
jgi:hypothetical protein